MKYLKDYKVFENAAIIDELKDDIIGLMSIYTPHVTVDEDKFTNDISDNNKTRDIPIYVSVDESKYGRLISINFLSDFPVYFEDSDLSHKNGVINDSFKNTNFIYDLIEVIKDHQEVDDVKLTQFNYFGVEVKGKKDGHTLNVENVFPKLRKVVSDFNKGEIESRNSVPIVMSFSFMVKYS